MKEVKYPVITREQSEAGLADYIFHRIQDLKSNIAKDILELGSLFTMVKEDMLYKYNGCDSFEEYIGQPEIGFKRTSVYNFIKIHRFFIIEKRCVPQKLLDVGHSKLTLIIPAIEKEPDKTDEWLDHATVWSRSDLINAVREAQGKPSMPIQANSFKTPPFSPELPSYKSYIEYTENQPCCVCGNMPIEKAHFPQHKGMGSKKVPEWHVIPLCDNCHREFHQHGILTFLDNYLNLIMDYFYDIIDKIWKHH